MFELMLASTAIVLAGGALYGYRTTRDVLHPLLFLGPLFLYGTVIDPWLVRHELSRFFVHEGDINFVVLLHFLAVVALVVGVLSAKARTLLVRRPQDVLQASDRLRLERIAWGLAIVGAVAYAAGVVNMGGFVATFSRPKGTVTTGIGYINEAMNLGLAAAAMVALSRYRRGWTSGTVVVLVLGLLPNLIQGTFGGRRGPLFLALTACVVSAVITRRKTPSLSFVAGSFAIVMLAVAFIASQRQQLYIGADPGEVDWQAFQTTLSQSEVAEGDNFIYGAGFVLATSASGRYTWGKELAVNLFIRPIPRQLWPTKYEDVGATWVTSDYPGLGHLMPRDWVLSVGWLPLTGSSAISVSDLFGEFGWGAVGAFYLIGRGFGALWNRRRTRGGVWDLLYFEALMVSIYLATQSFSAFYYRFLILAVPTIVFWRSVLRGSARTSVQSTAYSQRIGLRRGAFPASLRT